MSTASTEIRPLRLVYKPSSYGKSQPYYRAVAKLVPYRGGKPSTRSQDALYAYLDKGQVHCFGQGRVGAELIASYIKEMRKAFQGWWDVYKAKVKETEDWDKLWFHYRAKLSYFESQKSFKDWLKGKASITPLRGTASQELQIHVDVLFPYYSVLAEDRFVQDLAQDFMPFADPQQDGQKVTIGKPGQDIEVPLGGFCGLRLQVHRLDAVTKASRAYRAKIKDHLAAQWYVGEARRIFEKNTDKTLPDVKNAISRAKAANKAISSQQKSDAGPEWSQYQQAAQAAFDTLHKSPGNSLFSVMFAKLWHRHTGRFGTWFLFGYTLKLLKDSPVHKDVASYVRALTWEMPETARQFVLEHVERDTAASPFFGMRAPQAAKKRKDWAKFFGHSSWLQKASCILLDSLAWYNFGVMSHYINDTRSLLKKHHVDNLRSLANYVAGSPKVQFSQGTRDALSKLEAKFPDLNKTLGQLDAVQKVKLRPAPMKADLVDDLFSFFSKVADDTKKLPADPQGRRKFQDLLKAMGDDYQEAWKKALFKERASNVLEPVRAGLSVFCLGVSAYALGKTAATKGISVDSALALLDVAGNALGLAADFYSISMVLKDSLDGSRLVGASRVFGIWAAGINLVISIGKTIQSYQACDSRGVHRNFLVSIGCALNLIGFFLDGTVLGLPAGLVCNIIGTIIVIGGAFYDWLDPQSEGEQYLTKMLKIPAVKSLKIMKDRTLAENLIWSITSSSSYRSIPADTFISNPNIKLRCLTKDAVWGEDVDFELVTFRIDKGKIQVAPSLKMGQWFPVKAGKDVDVTKITRSSLLRFNSGDAVQRLGWSWDKNRATVQFGAQARYKHAKVDLQRSSGLLRPKFLPDVLKINMVYFAAKKNGDSIVLSSDKPTYSYDASRTPQAQLSKPLYMVAEYSYPEGKPFPPKALGNYSFKFQLREHDAWWGSLNDEITSVDGAKHAERSVNVKDKRLILPITSAMLQKIVTGKGEADNPLKLTLNVSGELKSKAGYELGTWKAVKSGELQVIKV